MRRIALLCLLVTSVLAGCLSNDTGTPPEGTGTMDTALAGHPTFVVPDHPVYVLDGHGNELDPSAYPGELPVFEQKTPSTRVSGEPTIGITRTKDVWYASIDFDAATGALPKTDFMRSQDEGATWEDRSPNVYGVETDPYSADPYVYVDPTTGRVFAVDMDIQANCNRIYWTDDGSTWVQGGYTCPVPIADHPSLVAGPGTTPNLGVAYPNNLYMCTNDYQLMGQPHCSVSYDGGVTWLNDQYTFPSGCNGLTGHSYASWVTGTVFSTKIMCGTPTVALSRDGGLNWQSVAVYTPTGQDDPMRGVGHEGAVSADQAGNVYYAWIGDKGNRTFLAVSHDDGATWDAPLDVTAPGVTAVTFPSIVAGSQGRVAVQYLGTTTPSGWHVHDRNQTDNSRLYPDELRNATWNAYIGIGLDVDTDAPVFAVTTGHDLAKPLKRGQCEGRCFGNVGGMYDFFDIDIDPIAGRVWTAMVDVCSGDCDLAGADGDSWQRAFGAVAKQTAGTQLLSEPIPAR